MPGERHMESTNKLGLLSYDQKNYVVPASATDQAKKRKKRSNNKEEGGLSADTSSTSSSPRKKKRCKWTNELRAKFVHAVNILGIKNSTPKKILALMNVPGLKPDHVSSYLQKYRKLQRKLEEMNQAPAPVAHVAPLHYNRPQPMGNMDNPLLNESSSMASAETQSTLLSYSLDQQQEIKLPEIDNTDEILRFFDENWPSSSMHLDNSKIKDTLLHCNLDQQQKEEKLFQDNMDVLFQVSFDDYGASSSIHPNNCYIETEGILCSNGDNRELPEISNLNLQDKHSTSNTVDQQANIQVSSGDIKTYPAT